MACPGDKCFVCSKPLQLINAAPDLLKIVQALDSNMIIVLHDRLRTINIDEVLGRIERRD